MIPTTNTISSSQLTSSSSITRVSPNLLTAKAKSFVVLEAIYYDNGTGSTPQSNQLILAKLKNGDSMAGKMEAKCNQSISNATNLNLVESNIHTITTTTPTTASPTIIKKPGIILLTQASLNKIFCSGDLNVLNNNNNIYHQQTNGRDKSNGNYPYTKAMGMQMGSDTSATTNTTNTNTGAIVSTITNISHAVTNGTNRISSTPSNPNTEIIISRINGASNRINSDKSITTTNHIHHVHSPTTNQIQLKQNSISHINSNHNNNNNYNNNNNQLKSVLMINSTLESTANAIKIAQSSGLNQSISQQPSQGDQGSTRNNEQQVSK